MSDRKIKNQSKKHRNIKDIFEFHPKKLDDLFFYLTENQEI